MSTQHGPGKAGHFDANRPLGDYSFPDDVIATRENSELGRWQDRDRRNLMHNAWRLCSDDRSKRRGPTTFAVPFDSAIDFDGVLLSDVSASDDCLSKKILCLRSLSVGIKRRRLSACTAFAVCYSFDWMVRWRRSRGIERMADLEPCHFEEFLECLRINDPLGLVPWVERLDRIVAEAAAGSFQLALRNDPRGIDIDWSALANKLGVGWSSLSRSRQFRLELIDRLPQLAPEHAKPLAQTIASSAKKERESRSTAAIAIYLQPWDWVAYLSETGALQHDPLQFNPFQNRTLHKTTQALGQPCKRTRTLLPADMFRLWDAAATWILDYSGHVMSVVEMASDERTLGASAGIWRANRLELMAQLDATAPRGMPKLWPGWQVPAWIPNNPDTHGRITLTDAVKFLLTAAGIFVGGWGGRRPGEIISLRKGCIIEERPGLCELSSYIEKTLRDIDRLPVPQMLKIVVSMLESLTVATRARTGKDWLFEVMRTATGSFVSFNFSRSLREFVTVCKLPPPSGTTEWDILPHQLRRGFSVYYYHGFPAASLDALSRFLRHFDPEVTRIYVNEILAGSMGRLREEMEARSNIARAATTEEDRAWLRKAKQLLDELESRGQVFNEVRCEALVHRMLQMWDGVEKPIGQGAARLYADLEAMVNVASAHVRIGARSNHLSSVREPLTRILEKYAQDHFLEPVPGHAAHCVCRPDNQEDLARAECLRLRASSRAPWASECGPTPGDRRPDYGFSSTYVCLSCVHCAAFSENQKVIANTLDAVEDGGRRAATSASKTAAEAKLAELKQALASAKAATNRSAQ